LLPGLYHFPNTFRVERGENIPVGACLPFRVKKGIVDITDGAFFD
jgi:hypothetical protein